MTSYSVCIYMRSKNLISIRPILDIDNKKSSSIESFQNITLRPILKQQHPITLSLLKHSKHYPISIQKVDTKNRSILDIFLKQYLSSNKELRSKIIGVIIGMMTEEELSYYMDNAQELNKRIVSMQLQRYADTLMDSV